jgi:predicted GNAT family acetyltransferase
MQPIDFLQRQMKLEGIGIDQNRELVPIYPAVQEFPFVLVASLVGSEGNETLAYWSAQLAPEIKHALQKSALALHFPDAQPLSSILDEHHIQYQAGHFKSYSFPEYYRSAATTGVKILPREDAGVRAFGFDHFSDTVYVIEKDGIVVSACVSSRQDDDAAEAWIFTSEQHRGLGYGKRVVAAWASGIMEQGLVPFYSHKITNTASARLAGSLGLAPLFEEINLESIG